MSELWLESVPPARGLPAELTKVRDETGRCVAVRDGYHQLRKVTTTAGVVDEVQAGTPTSPV